MILDGVETIHRLLRITTSIKIVSKATLAHRIEKIRIKCDKQLLLFKNDDASIPAPKATRKLMIIFSRECLISTHFIFEILSSTHHEDDCRGDEHSQRQRPSPLLEYSRQLGEALLNSIERARLTSLPSRVITFEDEDRRDLKMELQSVVDNWLRLLLGFHFRISTILIVRR